MAAQIFSVGSPLLTMTGDQVITAGLGEIYPRGLPVGTIVGVSRTEGDLFQEALVRPGVDLNHLEEMLILVAGGTQVAP